MEADIRFVIKGLVDGLVRTGALKEEQLPQIVQALADAGTEAGRENDGARYACHTGADELADAWNIRRPKK